MLTKRINKKINNFLTNTEENTINLKENIVVFANYVKGIKRVNNS